VKNVSVFTKRRLDQLTQPCVYQFMRGGECLYVGFSRQGIIRFLAPQHHCAIARQKATKIRVTWFDTVEEASLAEQKLIKKLRPAFNLTVPDHHLPPSRQSERHQTFISGVTEDDLREAMRRVSRKAEAA